MNNVLGKGESIPSKHTNWLCVKPNGVQHVNSTTLNQCSSPVTYKFSLRFYSFSLADAGLFLNWLQLLIGEAVIVFLFQFIKYVVHNCFRTKNERASFRYLYVVMLCSGLQEEGWRPETDSWDSQYQKAALMVTQLLPVLS